MQADLADQDDKRFELKSYPKKRRQNVKEDNRIRSWTAVICAAFLHLQGISCKDAYPNKEYVCTFKIKSEIIKCWCSRDVAILWSPVAMNCIPCCERSCE